MHSDVNPDHDIGLRQILGVEKFVKVNLQISSVQILERLEEVGAPVGHMRDFDSLRLMMMVLCFSVALWPRVFWRGLSCVY